MLLSYLIIPVKRQEDALDDDLFAWRRLTLTAVDNEYKIYCLEEPLAPPNDYNLTDK
jgi:hypothetical protein